MAYGNIRSAFEARILINDRQLIDELASSEDPSSGKALAAIQEQLNNTRVQRSIAVTDLCEEAPYWLGFLDKRAISNAIDLSIYS